MFTSKKVVESAERTKYFLFENDAPITNQYYVDLLYISKEFRLFFNELIASSPYEGILWESAPMKRKNLSAPYEFVLIDSKAIARLNADYSPFEEIFNENEAQVLSFDNLGRDARLVSVKPVSATTDFAHLAKLTRNASPEILDKFWQLVGDSLMENITDQPLWLNTNGFGVCWVHVRLDSRPKYYSYADYC